MLPAQRLLAYAALPVFWLGLAGPLYTLPVFKHGYWELAEPLVIGSFVAAGMAALLLAVWFLAGGRPRRKALMLALPAFALGLWLLFSGPDGFGLEQWRLRLLGTAQSGFGSLWFCALGLWLLLADLLRREGLAWRLALWGGLLISAGMAGILIADRITGRSTVFTVLAYYGWPALALPAIAYALPPLRLHWLVSRIEVLLALLLGLLLLVLCNAITLLGGGLIGLALTLSWYWLPQKGLPALLRRPPLQVFLLLSAALLPVILVSLPAIGEHVQSLESRRLVWLMLWAMLEQQPLYWLFGHGAGTVPDTMMQQLAAIGHPLWDRDSWDLLGGDYFHLHNWSLQALHDGGLPAVLLLTWLLLQPTWLASDARKGAALGFTLAYLICLGLWFELIFALPYLALAWLAFVLPVADEPEQSSPAWPMIWRLTMPAAALLLAGVYGWSALVLERFARQFDAQIAWLHEPDERQRPEQAGMAGPRLPPAPPYPDDPRRQDVVMADLMMALNGRFITRYADGQMPAMHERHVQRLEWQLRIIGEHLATAATPRFAFYASQLFSNVLLLPELEKLRPALLPHLPLWRQAIERGLDLAPRRQDIAQGYLDWTLQNGRADETLAMARLLRQRDPSSALGLYFEGGVLILRNDQAGRQQGLALLRRSLEAGIEQYFRLDDALKRQLGAL